jgi:AraC-like DNA-binding protein
MSNSSLPLNTLDWPLPVRSQLVPVKLWDWQDPEANTGWPRLTIKRFTTPAIESERQATPFLSIFVIMSGPVQQFRKDGHDERWHTRQPGDMILEAPDSSRVVSSIWTGSARTMNVYIPGDLLKLATLESTEGKFESLEFRSRAQFRDERLLWMLSAMCIENGLGRPLGELYLQTMALRFARHLVNTQAHWPDFARSRTLSSHARAAVINQIESKLDRPLSIAALAQTARVSEFHFAKAFKESMGLPPHQYVLQRRAERAHDLLRAGRHDSLADVAFQSGFSDQSHMGRALRRFFGVTPAQLAS